MKLYIQQRIFTFGDEFTIYDENGNEKYYVEGEVFTFGKKLHLYDLSGRELSYIEQRLMTFLPKYEVYVDGELEATVIREFTFFKQKYTVEGKDWTVDGDFFDHEYELSDKSGVIASVSKEWFTLGDAYEIELAEGEDEIAALSVVLIIDACIESNN